VTTTDSFTRCWKSAGVRRLLLLWLLALPLGWLQASPARAEAAAEITQMRLERDTEGILLYATLRVDLPPAVEEALMKGVPMVFVAEAEVMRHRWYWSDKVVASVQRHMRLAYQPLTRRWRLHIASGPITASSAGMTLSQSFDTLAEAMAALRRLSGWKVADASLLDSGATHKVEFRFSLDLEQLPRPFQIGAFGQSDWTIAARATQQIGPEAPK
jgi:hypothetical protein